MAEIGTDINKAKGLLEAGELVAIPTETVYGLAGNALDPMIVSKIFQVKKRPQFDPLIVHVKGIHDAKNYVEIIPPQAAKLANKFWPGPLTLVLPKKEIIPDIVSAGLDTIGIRCPKHSLTTQLISSLSFPLAAPSANPFGYVSPTQPEHVQEQLGDEVAYIIDGGRCDIGIESTIVGFENSVPTVYRMGGLSLEEIEKVIGTFEVRTHSSSNPKSPGQLKSHYSPSKKVLLGNIRELLKANKNVNVGVLSFKDDYGLPNQFVLSKNGRYDEAAKNLFIALRTLDKMNIDVILTELLPEIDLGRAINDRLRRAAAIET